MTPFSFSQTQIFTNENWFKASREERYNYLYSEKQLQEFSGPVIDIAASTVRTYVFFNNCHGGFAAKNGLMMKRILGIVEGFTEEQRKLMQ